MNGGIASVTRRTLVTAALLLIIGTADGAGQRIDSPYRFVPSGQGLGPFAGYIAAGRGALELGPENGAVFGARYGIRVSGPFTVEGDIGYFPTKRAVRDTVPSDTTLTTIGEADMALALARGALRFNLTGPRTFHGLQPFLVFGGGVAIDLTSDGEAEEDLPQDVRFDFGTSFAGELGGGIEWFLSEGVALRFDARNILWKLETPTGLLLGERALLLPDSEWAQNFFLTGGLSIRF